MKTSVLVIAISFLFTMVSCWHTPDPTGILHENTGTLELSVTMWDVGELRKTLKNADIEMEKCVIEFSAEGQATLLDTLELNGGNGERTERKTYTGLAA